MRNLNSQGIYVRRRPHPVISMGGNRDYIRVLLYSYYTTITGWGVLLTYTGGSHNGGVLPNLRGTQERGLWVFKGTIQVGDIFQKLSHDPNT